MADVLENVVPQAGILNKEENTAIDSDRVEASVVDAGSTDFGGSQKHNVANQAGAEGMDRFAPTASKKTSEEEGEVNQASVEAAAFRALRIKGESVVDFILGKKNLHTQQKNMARCTNRVLTKLDKLLQSPKPKKTVSSNKDRSSQTSPLFHKVKAIQKNSKRDGTTHLKHRGRRRQKEAEEGKRRRKKRGGFS